MTKRYRALIVDDSSLMRQLLGVSLARLRTVSFDEANDGLEALRLLATNRYDIVLADINMPVMDGLKLIKKLRSDARHADVPVVVISTEPQQDNQSKLDGLRVSAYLTKPVNGAQVCETIAALLHLD